MKKLTQIHIFIIICSILWLGTGFLRLNNIKYKSAITTILDRSSSNGFHPTEDIKSEIKSYKTINSINSLKSLSNSNPIVSNNYNVSDYGFRMRLPQNKSFFNQFPMIIFEILNETIISRNNYNYSISNNSYPESYTNFNPLNSLDISSIINQIHYLWNNTNETIPIFIKFSVNETISAYNLQITKDFHPPEFSIGLSVSKSGILNVFNNEAELKYVITAPIIYLNISDNVNNCVTVFYTINNQRLSYSDNITSYGADLIYQNLTSFILENWINLPEGVNLISFYVNDTAGNPSDIIEISFKKDSISPRFLSNNPGKYWIQVENKSLLDFVNPVYNIYEMEERPIFKLNFIDNDITDVQIYLNVSEDYFQNLNAMSNISYQSLLFVKLNLNKIDLNSWKCYFPNRLWSLYINTPITVSILVYDEAGNISQFSFTLIHIKTNEYVFELTLFYLLSFAFIFFAMISSSYFFIFKKTEKILPVERDLESLDPEMLDVALKPMDSEKSKKFLDYTKKFKKKVDLDYITPPDLQKFIKTPIQMVDLLEIKKLLVNYKMDPIEQENFIREMISMTPIERKEFLKDYMGQFDENIDNIDDIDEIDDIDDI